MRRNLELLASAILCVVCFASAGGCDTDVSATVEKCNPSVVLVRVLDSAERLLSTGSGFVVAPGLVATCYHVVAGGAEARVKTLDRVEYPVAEVAAANRALDIALLRVNAMYSAPALELRSSSDLQVGEVVIAMGSPFGLQGTVTTGIVSAVREMGDWGTVIQTSAPVSPGNSGGPLVDAQGRAVGLVMSTMIGGQNVNFAVPVDAIRGLMGEPGDVGSSLRDVTGSGAADTELLKPYGELEPKTGTFRLRVPRREPFSAVLPSHHRYSLDAVRATVWDKGKPIHLRQGKTLAELNANTFWVSDLGVLWFDAIHANRDIDVTAEYRPRRIAVLIVQDASDGDLRDILVERCGSLGDEVLVGADVGAAVARCNYTEGENRARELGGMLDCSHLLAGSLNSDRARMGLYSPDLVKVSVSLALVDLNTGKVIVDASRETFYTLGWVRKGGHDRRVAAQELVDQILSSIGWQ